MITAVDSLCISLTIYKQSAHTVFILAAEAVRILNLIKFAEFDVKLVDPQIK